MTLADYPKRMRFYRIRFRRLSTGSTIAFVAATKLKRPKASLRGIFENKFPGWIFENKFPGWIFEVKEISERVFVSQIDASHEASKIDIDLRHPDELFVEVRKVAGNFFDPWRFT